MNKEMIGAEDIRWDLSVFYSGLNDPRLESDLEDYAGLSVLSDKIGHYLFFRQSLDTGDAEVKAKTAEAERKLSAAGGEYLTFFTLELVDIPDETLEKLYADNETAKKHRPWVEYLRVFKPHLLSEPVESALTKRSPFGDSAWSGFFDELEADLRFRFGGKEKTLTEMLSTLTNSQDRIERAGALQIINDGLSGPFAKYSAQTLHVVAGLGAVEDKERGYKNPMDSRNKSNRVSDVVVDALHSAITKTAGPLAQRWYRLKAAHLGMKKLKWSDRNAPLPFVDTSVVPFKDAMATVLAAYESFSPTLAGIIRKMVAEKRLDAPVTKGRRGGAYNASLVFPGGKVAAFTFLNYLGSTRDVMTLAHELGHGVHGTLSGEAQGPLM